MLALDRPRKPDAEPSLERLLALPSLPLCNTMQACLSSHNVAAKVIISCILIDQSDYMKFSRSSEPSTKGWS